MKVKTRSWLVVEGYDDLYSVVSLMRAHTDWPEDKSNAPVWIDIGKSVDEIIEPVYLQTLLKASNIDVLGILLDAEQKDPGARYGRIRDICSSVFPGLPADLPAAGVISEHGGKRMGVWVMPDNVARGGLETFLRALVPPAQEPLWNHAVESATKAKQLGAEWRDVHRHKAYLYTWMAWHDPPGQNPGRAITKKCLDPTAGNASAFVRWFKELYRLKEIQQVLAL
ncbi:MAG TPA: DUF3226 domain-containing protein [Terracidiphilus sp.]|nr:DUF3226 domain-containing protein [Terracidiphilus sp.]